ncbi:hypothetical protein HAZT_HAZT001291 [Hyalella azteca]|uniref:Uncharacterized protein n=1 Tax=Hyalella azteca TaxID=294128 RepID=A0A6A0GT46_HYAAZ|nr:hypothetical protein HAZT_HAZT001291 [Hyalella azteca]
MITCHYRGIIRRNSIWDKLVFRKVQEGMGGRLRLVVVGSAPLAGNVLTFTRCALGCVVSGGGLRADGVCGASDVDGAGRVQT